MSSTPERRLAVVSGDPRLEAAIRDGDGGLAAIVLHPHPLYGGDMDNHVVTGICEALAAHGATTLRFNFREAGRSDGSYDGGHGEARTPGPPSRPCVTPCRGPGSCSPAIRSERRSRRRLPRTRPRTR